MPDEDFHLADHARSQAHERGRLARTRCGQDGRAPRGELLRRYARRRRRANPSATKPSSAAVIAVSCQRWK